MLTFHSIAYFVQHEGTGHFYHLHKAVQKAVEPLMQEVSVYVPLKAHFDAAPPGWKQWFNLFNTRTNRRKFLKDCIRLFKQPSDGPRIFFLEFFGRKDFALYSLAALLFARKQDFLWILYRDDLSIRRKKDLKTIRFFSKLIQLRFRRRFVPLTDSELLIEACSKWFGFRPTLFPILSVPYQPVKVSLKDKVVCTWLGNPRPEKGEIEIARLVEIQDPAAARIVLNLSGATYFPPVKNQLTIQLRKAYLTEGEYYASLNESDVVLLPYDPIKYKMRTSGAFVEAILSGKVPLVKQGSWLAYELKRFGLDELIIDWNHPQFFTQLLTTLKSPTLSVKLAQMQQAYHSFHSEAGFVSTLHSLVKRLQAT
jgi:hypothetical protein